MKGDARLGASVINARMEEAFKRVWERLYQPALEALFSEGVPPGVYVPTVRELQAMPMEQAAATLRTLQAFPMSQGVGLQLARRYGEKLLEDTYDNPR